MGDGIDFAELERRRRDKPDYDVEQLASDKAGKPRVKASGAPLDLLYKRKTITQRQYDAGNKLRGLCGTAASGLACPAYDGVPVQSSGPVSMPQAVIAANTDLARLLQGVGKRVSTLLISVCYYGESVSSVYGPAKTKAQIYKCIGQFQSDLGRAADIIGLTLEPD